MPTHLNATTRWTLRALRPDESDPSSLPYLAPLFFQPLDRHRQQRLQLLGKLRDAQLLQQPAKANQFRVIFFLPGVPFPLPLAGFPQPDDVAAPLPILVRRLPELLQSQRDSAQIARQMRQPFRRCLAEKPRINQTRQLLANVRHRLGPNRVIAQAAAHLVINR